MTQRFRIVDKTKIFDPADGFSPLTNVGNVTDSTIVKRNGHWWMYLAGTVIDKPGIHLFSASLPQGAPLAAKGWILTPETNAPSRIALLADYDASSSWDLKGGRHCPAYVRGWDPDRQEWIERIYYAGGAEQLWGPYTIGYLEWNGTKWVDQPSPVFRAEEEWEHGSVYEPNLIYADGKWKMWYVAGSNHEDYIVHAYAESPDGRTNWTKHKIFASPELKLFDFRPIQTGNGHEAVFSRVWLAPSQASAETGLWWCECDRPSGELSDWSEPVQIMNAEDGIPVRGDQPCTTARLTRIARLSSSTESTAKTNRARFHLCLRWAALNSSGWTGTTRSEVGCGYLIQDKKMRG